jgi:hypothetical protein
MKVFPKAMQNAMHADPDGYVEELAKLGIAKIPGYEPPSVAGISTVAQPHDGSGLF